MKRGDKFKALNVDLEIHNLQSFYAVCRGRIKNEWFEITLPKDYVQQVLNEALEAENKTLDNSIIINEDLYSQLKSRCSNVDHLVNNLISDYLEIGGRLI